MARRFFFRLLSAAAPAGDHVPDSELLRRFTRSRDSAAFELLVRRHANAVWAAVLRVLRHEADAEDAFQATFLVLARRAGSIRGDCAGGWLHRVAVNAALKLKASRERERPEGGPTPVAHAPGSPETDELAAVVHQELARLPDRYRLPVVLCDLEGHTHAEAAAALGWPVGTVSGRLSRAHALLRDRLTRRGLAPAAVLLTASAAPTGAVRAASATGGSVVVSPVVSSLAEGVLSAMRTARLKLTAALAAGLLGLAGTGTLLALGQIPAPRAPGEEAQKTPEKSAPGVRPKSTEPHSAAAGPDFTAFPELKPVGATAGRDAVPKGKETFEDLERALAKLCPRIFGGTPVAIDPTDDTYRRLLKARLEQGRQEVNKTRQVIMIGKWSPQEYEAQFQCQEDMRAAAIELWANDPKTLVPWLQEFVILAKEWESYVKARVDAGIDPPQMIHTARRYRLRVEAALWKAKNPPPAGP